MLNYSVHAIEQLSQRLEGILLPREDTLALRELIGFLDKGIKFELPVNGTLFDDDMEKGYDLIDPSLLNLPFSTVVLEYPFEFFKPKAESDNIPSPKRIAVCLDYHFHKDTLIGRTTKQFCPYIDDTGGIILFPIFYFQDSWNPSPWGVVLPKVAPDGSNLSVYYYGKGLKPKQTQVGFMPIFTIRSVAQRLVQDLGGRVAVDNAMKDCNEEITSLIGLLAVLSCSNVKLTEEPAPAKLNAKRIKNGKLPFYSYKVVTIDVSGTTRGKAGGGEVSMTGRQSPREHLRRGHIRRLSPTKNTWVQAAVIGAASKGHIDKTYTMGRK